VVVGLGNEIARDDGVGILTARRLERLLARRGDAEAIPLPWAGLALLDVLRGRRRAALVDCLTTGRLAPGTVVRFRADERHGDDRGDFPGSVRLNSFHDLDFATSLALGREIGWSLPEEIAVWGVEGGVVDEFGEGLSPSVLAAADRVVAEVLDFLTPISDPGAGPESGTNEDGD
jgi:hydrogenase maturation protease